MQKKLDQFEFRAIESLVNSALYAHSKKDAEPYISRLENILPFNIDSYAKLVFRELLSYTKNASGRVSDKPMKTSLAKQHLHKFQIFGVDSNIYSTDT